MPKYKIVFNFNYQASPLSYWVHHNIDSEIWEYASIYEPKLPVAIVSKGYLMLIVDALGHELRFSSIQEINHFLGVVKQKNMPTSSSLVSKRSKSIALNSHWLSRLPAKLKSFRNRQKYIPIVEHGLIAMKKVEGRFKS